jgi:Asp-tRNA(Asn)/Glu-tRNA(Gln) amidotransferase A subunit family amidase
LAAVDTAAAALGPAGSVELPGAARAQAAAYVITATEAAALHLDRLRTRPGDFDPAVRDRSLAGALVPAPLGMKAQKFRQWFCDRTLRLFQHTHILLAPSTPCPAPLLGQTTLDLAGQTVPLRPNIGIYTQPISFIGLPVAAVPVWLPNAPLPIGVQAIAAAWRENPVLRAAWHLEQSGVCQWRPCS